MKSSNIITRSKYAGLLNKKLFYLTFQNMFLFAYFTVDILLSLPQNKR